jgi:heme A synthase
LGGILRTIAVGIGIILIIIAGIIIMTSGGNTEKLDKGKKMLKWTLIGFAIVTVASFIIDLLKELLAPIL